jgi:hypothetical protein
MVSLYKRHKKEQETDVRLLSILWSERLSRAATVPSPRSISTDEARHDRRVYTLFQEGAAPWSTSGQVIRMIQARPRDSRTPHNT